MKQVEIEDKLIKLQNNSSEMNSSKSKLSKGTTRIEKHQSWGWYPLDWEFKKVYIE